MCLQKNEFFVKNMFDIDEEIDESEEEVDESDVCSDCENIGHECKTKWCIVPFESLAVGDLFDVCQQLFPDYFVDVVGETIDSDDEEGIEVPTAVVIITENPIPFTAIYHPLHGEGWDGIVYF